MQSSLYSTDFPRIHSYPPPRLNKCTECGSATIEKYQTNPRQIRRLGGFQELIEHIHTCPNPTCEKYNQNIDPERLTPYRSAYHFEVIHEVGRLRRLEKKTFLEILKCLKRQNVPIGASSSCVKHLFTYYEIYEQGWADHSIFSHCQGQDVILTLDGAKPENGTATLYLVGDATESVMYHSQWLLYSGKDQITELLQQVNRLDLNVVGVVSDKQRAILLAVREVFGNIPHQFCQFHWFLAAFRRLSALDRGLNKEVKKQARQLRTLTRHQEERIQKGKIPTHNLAILTELAPYLTVILQAKNKPPFILKGVQNWNSLKLILAQTLTSLEDLPATSWKRAISQISPEQKSLRQIVKILTQTLEPLTFRAWEVSQGAHWLQTLVPLLDPLNQPFDWSYTPHPCWNAEHRFRETVAGFNTFGSSFLFSLKQDILDHFEKWKKGLLACFDRSYLPRTNNHLERYIYHLKQGRTKTTGRRNNHSTLRHQQCFLYQTQSPTKVQFIKYCEALSREQYQTLRKQHFDRIAPLIKEHRIKRNFPKMVTELFDVINQEVSVSVICT